MLTIFNTINFILMTAEDPLEWRDWFAHFILMIFLSFYNFFTVEIVVVKYFLHANNKNEHSHVNNTMKCEMCCSSYSLSFSLLSILMIFRNFVVQHIVNILFSIQRNLKFSASSSNSLDRCGDEEGIGEKN